jgi:hypothetical protein
MKETYIVLSEQFAKSMEGKKAGNIEFYARQTTDGRWVCAEQSAIDFSNDFRSIEPLILVELDTTDFPTEIIVMR